MKRKIAWDEMGERLETDDLIAVLRNVTTPEIALNHVIRLRELRNKAVSPIWHFLAQFLAPRDFATLRNTCVKNSKLCLTDYVPRVANSLTISVLLNLRGPKHFEHLEMEGFITNLMLLRIPEYVTSLAMYNVTLYAAGRGGPLHIPKHITSLEIRGNLLPSMEILSVKTLVLSPSLQQAGTLVGSITDPMLFCKDVRELTIENYSPWYNLTSIHSTLMPNISRVTWKRASVEQLVTLLHHSKTPELTWIISNVEISVDSLEELRRLRRIHSPLFPFLTHLRIYCEENPKSLHTETRGNCKIEHDDACEPLISTIFRSL